MTVSDHLLSSKFQKSWCRIQKQLTLKREDYWMKTLRTIYPYSLNERVIKHDSEVPVGELLFSILEGSNDLLDMETTLII